MYRGYQSLKPSNLNFIPGFVKEMILQKMVRRHGSEINPAFKLSIPFHSDGR
jgi:hypothetical protein